MRIRKLAVKTRIYFFYLFIDAEPIPGGYQLVQSWPIVMQRSCVASNSKHYTASSQLQTDSCYSFLSNPNKQTKEETNMPHGDAIANIVIKDSEAKA